MQRGAHIAIGMTIYGGLLLATGVWAFQSAPEDASATTALIVPGVMAGGLIACAAMSLFLETRPLIGKLGVNLGLMLPLLFAGAVGWRAWVVNDYQVRRNAVVQEYDESPAGRVVTQGEIRDTYLASKGVLSDKTYLRDALFAMSGMSIFAFFGLLAVRPTPRDGV